MTEKGRRDFCIECRKETEYLLQKKDIVKIIRDKEYVFGSEYGRGNNEAQLQCMIDNKLDTETIVNDFAIKSPADTNKYKLPFKYGFVTGVPGEGLGEKFGIDFSGYHTQA